MLNNSIEKEKMSFADWLQISFINLKLCNFIDWSWWWVLSPIWIVFVLTVIYKLAKSDNK